MIKAIAVRLTALVSLVECQKVIPDCSVGRGAYLTDLAAKFKF